MGSKIAIIGLGLIGTSLGMALKRASADQLELVGHDRERSNADKAKKRGAVDKVESFLPNAVREAEVVIISTPVVAIGEVMRDISSHLREHCVVTDTGSTKVRVLEWAKDYLPPQASFIGGHPMAGKEVSGPDAADPELFKGVSYCVIPSVRADQEAVQVVTGLVQAIGAKPFFLDANEHDSFVAAVSHLPIILSSALISATNNSPSWREISRLVATGYKDVTRLASGDPEMNRDICLTNRDYISYWIDVLIEELKRYKELMAGPKEPLFDQFIKVWEARNRVMHGVLPREDSAATQVPSASQMFFGTYITGRLAQTLSKMSQEAERQGKRGKEPHKK